MPPVKTHPQEPLHPHVTLPEGSFQTLNHCLLLSILPRNHTQVLETRLQANSTKTCRLLLELPIRIRSHSTLLSSYSRRPLPLRTITLRNKLALRQKAQYDHLVSLRRLELLPRRVLPWKTPLDQCRENRARALLSR